MRSWPAGLCPKAQWIPAYPEALLHSYMPLSRHTPSSLQWVFDRFRFDPDHACLWRDTEAIALPPKTFAVLHYLVTHPDRLVTKDELLDAVWPETAVTDAVL